MKQTPIVDDIEDLISDAMRTEDDIQLHDDREQVLALYIYTGIMTHSNYGIVQLAHTMKQDAIVRVMARAFHSAETMLKALEYEDDQVEKRLHSTVTKLKNEQRGYR